MSTDVPDPPVAAYYSDEVILYGVRLDDKTKVRIQLPFWETRLVLTVKRDKPKEVAGGEPDDGEEPDDGDDTVDGGDTEDEVDAGLPVIVAYGYAFEGYCYRFDRPRVLIIAGTSPADGEPARGCGFGGYGTDSEIAGPPRTTITEGGYRMWRIRKGDSIVDMTIAMGTADDLILQPNLPGNRAPNTYGNKMAVGHRGKQLTGMSGA